MSRIRAYGGIACACVLLCATQRPAAADDDYFGSDAPPENIQFRMDEPRTARQYAVIGGLFGGALAFGGLGLGFHLHGKSLSDEISSDVDHTGQIYDRDIDDKRSSANTARTVAIVGYSIGGAFLIAGAVALYLTEPEQTVVTVGKKKQENAVPPAPVPVSRLWLAPARGGAMVGTGWRF